jgi:hypothetical protein
MKTAPDPPSWPSSNPAKNPPKNHPRPAESPPLAHAFKEFHFAKQSAAHSLDKHPSQQQISGRFAPTLAPTRRFSPKWHAKRLI